MSLENIAKLNSERLYELWLGGRGLFGFLGEAMCGIGCVTMIAHNSTYRSDKEQITKAIIADRDNILDINSNGSGGWDQMSQETRIMFLKRIEHWQKEYKNAA